MKQLTRQVLVSPEAQAQPWQSPALESKIMRHCDLSQLRRWEMLSTRRVLVVMVWLLTIVAGIHIIGTRIPNLVTLRTRRATLFLTLDALKQTFFDQAAGRTALHDQVAVKPRAVPETWAEPPSFEITIRPHFWHHWWVQLLIGLLFLSIIYAVYAWRIHTLSARQQQKLMHLKQLQNQRLITMRQLLGSIQVINSQLEITAVLQNIAEESARLVDGIPGGIGLVQGDRVVFQRQWLTDGWQASNVWFQFGEGTPGKVARSAKAIIVNNPEDEPISFAPEQARKSALQGWMDVPILTRSGTVTAVLNIRHRPGRPPFTSEDLNLIELLASQAAVAIENASLYGEVEEKNLMIAESFHELERLYQQEQEVSRTLQELNQMKTNFIVVTSHEMRTPLTVIRGYTEALLSEFFGQLNPVQHQSLSVTQRTVDRMIDNFNNILEMLKINEGKFTLRPEPTSLKELIHEVREELGPFIEKRKQTLTVIGTDFVAGVDRQKFGLVLLNVVQNAIKFTPDDGTIQIALEEEEKSIHIQVRDTGIGIEANELDRIFDRFYTTSDPSTHR
ncbi:MAG TPA: GAF domain-containing protein, partial [Acidobacteriota bacterium]|nr:GAF domain-containing protein [Acidobacteriota bacterium]